MKRNKQFQVLLKLQMRITHVPNYKIVQLCIRVASGYPGDLV